MTHAGAVDIAVVGAGPAGAWTACVLARRGARVLLIDPSHPREKPCGGGVTARALALVADAVDLQTFPAVPIRSARFAGPSSPVIAGVSLDDQALVVASRTEFDGALVDAARRAGAAILASRVTQVRALAGGFEIDTAAGSRRAAVIVGADGANSLVRRTLASAFRRDQLSIATGFFAHGVTSADIVIEFVCDPPGYIWSFPRPTHLAIGICAQADRGVTATGLRHAAAAWIRRTGIATGARLEPYSWPIPSLSAADFATLSPSGPGWYLIGDAAGLVDPITREGIYFALLSAQWTADAILSGAAAASQHYARRVREEIGADLGRAARFKEFFFRPRFTRLLIEALQHSAGIRTVMADLVAGQQDYAGLKWRLVKTLRPGLAARLLWVHGSGFKVQGSGFEAQRSGFRLQGSGFTVQGSGTPGVRNGCINLNGVDPGANLLVRRTTTTLSGTAKASVSPRKGGTIGAAPPIKTARPNGPELKE